MIISSNSIPQKVEFEELIGRTVATLNSTAKKSASTISYLTGNKLEPYVRDVMSELAIGTVFENSIKLIGGQKFPDIVAKRYFGIEVKTTTQDHWKTTGNSVLESTRVDDVERIFLLFAKLAAPIEFRCRPYEECLSEIVVTHSPRYLIDMNLRSGHTIFDKINTPYDTLRKYDNPIKPIVSYYKSKLKPGEELWWIDQDNTQSSNLVIKTWSNLTASEKQAMKTKAMAFFPELFSNRIEKFARFSVWLITREGIVCPNVRDLFTAGGKGTIIIDSKTYEKVPRIFLNLFHNLESIIKVINQTPNIELTEYWGIETTDDNKIENWIGLTSEHAKKALDPMHLDLQQMLMAKLRT
jgi:hypothetical protein